MVIRVLYALKIYKFRVQSMLYFKLNPQELHSLGGSTQDQFT